MALIRKSILNGLEKKWLYSVTAVLWLTGIVWFILRYLIQEGEFGSSNQTMLLKIHGLAAMAFLFVLGIIFRHIFPGWQNVNQRKSGFPLLLISVVLILTGWGLYYFGDEHLRNVTSQIHSGLGIILPLIILIHIWKYISGKTK